MAGNRRGGDRPAFRIAIELVGGGAGDTSSAEACGRGARGGGRKLEYAGGSARTRRSGAACAVVQSDDTAVGGSTRAADTGRACGGVARSGAASGARTEESAVSIADYGGEPAEGEQPES